MKTAEERARELLTRLGVPWNSDLLRDVALSFKEHARDQRRVCAEQVERIGSVFGVPAVDVLVRAHSLAMNAPEPGKEQ